jgi:Fe-S cluster assembly ATP-binding protein
MLTIKDLHVEIEGREILHGINLTIEQGETHVLMGPNGSGKSTLLMTLMGFDAYVVTQGSIHFHGVNITKAPVNERAKLGLGLMFQRPPTISGLKLEKLLKTIGSENEAITEKVIENAAEYMQMDTFMERDLNKGFSGGEIKRSEVLQMMIQRPSLVLLDEPESGVDIENIHLMGEAIASILQKKLQFSKRTTSGLIITHTGYILDYLDADQGHVMINGEFKCHGNPREILKLIKEKGYNECLRC